MLFLMILSYFFMPLYYSLLDVRFVVVILLILLFSVSFVVGACDILWPQILWYPRSEKLRSCCYLLANAFGTHLRLSCVKSLILLCPIKLLQFTRFTVRMWFRRHLRFRRYPDKLKDGCRRHDLSPPGTHGAFDIPNLIVYLPSGILNTSQPYP